MAYLMATSAGQVLTPPAQLQVPGGRYMDVRKFFQDANLGVIVPEDSYPDYNLYPVQFHPKPAYHPYRQRVIYTFAFNAGEQRIDQVWHVETLTQTEIEALYPTWVLPRHRVLWMLAHAGWEDWWNRTVSYLNSKHATDSTEYPDFVAILHKPLISAQDMLDARDIALQYENESGATSIPPTEIHMLYEWNIAWEKENA